MKELICINPKNYKLTESKIYPIVIDEGETVMIVNDSNKTVRYYKDLFQEVEEEVIPEPEVILRTEQDLIDSIASDDENTTYVDFNNQIVVIENRLDVIGNSNAFSCGIKNVINIGNQLEEIYEKISNTEETSEEDLPLLAKAVIKYHFKTFIKDKSADNYNGGIYLMSCNITGDSCLEDEVIDILDEISDFNTEPEINPNSGNEIKLWGFYKSNLDN